MNRRYRLRRSSEFKRVRRTGKSFAHPLAVLVAAANGLTLTRFGVTAGRSVGNAVTRNRAKRRLREILRGAISELEPGWDIVIIAREPAAHAAWNDLKKAVAGLLERSGVIAEIGKDER